MSVNKLFLSVGAMKAGTTFLFNALSRHPDLHFTPEKELHYFAHIAGLSSELSRPLRPRRDVPHTSVGAGQILTHDFRRHRLATVMRNRYARVNDAAKVRDITSWYAERYLIDPIDQAWFKGAFETPAGSPGDKWCCEFSNYNALLSEAGWAAVRRHCAELRVMYVMREPVERLWSHIKFEFLPAGKRQALIDGDLDEIDRFLASHSSAHARYTSITESLQRNLAPQERFIVKLEDILADLPGQLGKLSDFLGIARIDFAGVNPARKSNVTEALPIPPHVLERLRSALAPELTFYETAGAALART
ncbi:MAG: sulfotransferase [Hyphomonadaceae bacterium]|nr:sulfotransferase [Hyphomonadaceae bacterium]